MWFSRKHSRRKIKPQLERLDDRAVPAVFGGMGFGGLAFSAPAARFSGAFGMNHSLAPVQTRASLMAANRFGAQFASQQTSFGGLPLSNRPFFSAFNTRSQMTFPVRPASMFGAFNTPGGQANPFGARSVRFLTSNIARFTPLTPNGFGSSFGAITGFDAVTPTHPFPFGPGGLYSVVETPSGPAGLF